MPLAHGYSKSIIQKNIRELMHTGKYKPRQAVAIAYSAARRSAEHRHAHPSWIHRRRVASRRRAAHHRFR